MRLPFLTCVHSFMLPTFLPLVQSLTYLSRHNKEKRASALGLQCRCKQWCLHMIFSKKTVFWLLWVCYIRPRKKKIEKKSYTDNSPTWSTWQVTHLHTNKPTHMHLKPPRPTRPHFSVHTSILRLSGSCHFIPLSSTFFTCLALSSHPAAPFSQF